jgi:hypothetical protein
MIGLDKDAFVVVDDGVTDDRRLNVVKRMLTVGRTTFTCRSWNRNVTTGCGEGKS